MADKMCVTSLMTHQHNAATECQQCGSPRIRLGSKDGNALRHFCSGSSGDVERVPTGDALRAAVSSIAPRKLGKGGRDVGSRSETFHWNLAGGKPVRQRLTSG